MRLRSLYIKGFKSFANETILNFNDDVIGVVGPNGAGKSNVVDAIRWVLGEQKGKELRLESMSDVIFNGTKTRKEAAVATVSLTFENDKNLLPTDYNTVTISRILYRSGESEYRLNNVVCRLKDINSLFLDTGIGSNSYAIIVLGMVDDILSDKDNARRRMFEQAAGISKYKVRKRETLSKLKSAEEDLNRVDDLLFEIEGNLKSLEKQAKRTLKYNEIKDEYKNFSIKHAILSIQSLKTQYKQTAEQLRTEQDKYKDLDIEIYKLQAILEKEKKKNLDKEMEVGAKQKALGELVNKIRTEEGAKSLLIQTIGFKKENKANIKKSLIQSEESLSNLEKETKELLTKLESEKLIEKTIKLEVDVSGQQHDQIKAEYAKVKTSFDQNQQQRQIYEKEAYEFEKKYAILNNNVDNAQQEIFRISQDLHFKEQQVQESQQKLKETNQQTAQKNQEINFLLQKETERNARIKNLQEKLEKSGEDLNRINRLSDSRKNEFDLLKSMIDNYEGFPESIKFLSENWKKNPVILTDVIQVQEPYKAPIEQYLENYLHYFIVKDINEAISAIRMLRDGQKGKANFFILDKVLPDTNTNTEIAFAKPAIDVVDTDPEYSELIKLLLKNTYIVNNDLDNFQLDSDFNQFTFLSLSGTFQKSGYTFSGGSVGLFEGKKIGRKQNLEKLAKEIVTLETSKVKLETAQSQLKNELSVVNHSDNASGMDILKKELQILEQNEMKAKLEISTFEKFREESKSRIQLNEKTIKDYSEEIEKIQLKIVKIKEQIHVMSQNSDSSDQDLDMLYQKLSNATEQFNNDNIKLIRQQNLINNLIKDQTYKDSRIEEYKNKIQVEKNRFTSEERERIDLEDRIIRLDAHLAELYQEKNSYQNTLGEAEELYFKARNLISDYEEKIRQLTRTQNQMQQNIQQLKDQFTESRFQINAVGERLKIEFGVAINDIINTEPDNDIQLEDLSTQLENLRSKINNFGEINPLAIETFKEMSERAENIILQRKDIMDAKSSLMETIKAIEHTATDQFSRAFENIRNNFIKVFRSLFTNDDTCDLVLLDPANPLDSEIEIIAKPKGKKPKSLSQLSGGEKTLTATALLFALYLLKPAPFCVFDEVDAPLDDANIQKFNNIIKTFSKDSQFIIVTHNKATMAEVDTLYGVYMQEPGVSAVSAVDFSSYKHQPVLETLN